MMNRGTDRFFPVKSVLKSGRSLNLAKGQFGIIDLDATPTNDGLKVISSFSGLSKDNKLQIRLGKADLPVNRSQSNKAWASLDFTLADVKQLRVSAPTEGIKTDELVMGYDGFNASSAITLAAKDNEEVSITLSGPSMGMLGYVDNQVTIVDSLHAPDGTKSVAAVPPAGTWTDHEVVEKLVERLKAKTLLGDRPITDFVEITTVNSKNPAVGAITGDTDATFWNLTVEDDGTATALGLVQGQFNGYKVVRTDRTETESVYTIVADRNIVLASAGFTVGKEYIIVTVGTTSFTGIGASANTIGVRFTATGAGSGTGTALEVPTADYVVNKAWKVKGCAACPSGYSEFEDGYVYSISLEDDGANSAATILAISANTVAGTAVRVGMEGGLSTYTVVVNVPLSDSEISTFVGTNPETEIKLVAKNVAEICSPDNSTSYQWLEGDTCKYVSEQYSIIVPQDECGTAPTAKIQAAYPELSVSFDSSANCQSKYLTSTVSNIVCEECTKDFRDLFVTSAPADYGIHSWKKADKVYDGEALMGIRIKAKPMVISGSESFRDDMPSIATSTRLSMAGGYATEVSHSFSAGNSAGRFSVSVLSVASEPENWGMNLREWEDSARVYFDGTHRLKGNNYGKWVLGQESSLEGTSPYVDYILTIQKSTLTQGVYAEKKETMYYHFLVQPGMHQDVEDVLNALAGEAGVKTVQAYGKTAV